MYVESGDHHKMLKKKITIHICKNLNTEIKILIKQIMKRTVSNKPKSTQQYVNAHK